MEDIETLGIVDEIQALVSDKLQVVSYKWLSRNFLVSSDVAKRLLQEFVEKHGNGLEVVYTLSGWLKNNPSAYHIKLVSRPNLAEAKGEFSDNCSVQVYSVQACIPKDPAALWNSEFIQAEELFKQPPTVDNCLRDNRFCGVSNPFVKRNTDGTPLNTAAPNDKVTGFPGQSSKNPPQETASVQKPQQSISNVKIDGAQQQSSKATTDKEKVPQVVANKGQNGKSSTGSGGSLASMWGRASSKPKPVAISEPKTSNPKPAQAEVCAPAPVEEGISDDDDHQDVNFKRSSNGEGSRKRRFVFDDSDEEDEFKDAVSLSSPDPPKQFSKSSFDSKSAPKPPILEKNKLDFKEEKEDKQPKVKIEKATNSECNRSLQEESSVLSKANNGGVCSSLKTQSPIQENDANMEDKVPSAKPGLPKRKKVLKTKIDERGREVTEVVWEGEEAETKSNGNAPKKVEAETKSNGNAPKKAEVSTVQSTDKRPPLAKKSPAVGNTAPSGRGGNKKAGTKDPKQGNILSFFKKV